MPGLRRGDPVKYSTGRVPVLEGRDIYRDSVAARDLRHSRGDLNTEHIGASLDHQQCCDPGSTANVENFKALRIRAEKNIDHSIRISRSTPVVTLGLLVKQLRTFARQRLHMMNLPTDLSQHLKSSPSHWRWRAILRCVFNESRDCRLTSVRKDELGAAAPISLFS